jgi:hypothetical protein
MERRTRRAGRVAGGRWKGEGQTRVSGMKFEREIWVFSDSGGIDWGVRQMERRDGKRNEEEEEDGRRR